MGGLGGKQSQLRAPPGRRESNDICFICLWSAAPPQPLRWLSCLVCWCPCFAWFASRLRWRGLLVNSFPLEHVPRKLTVSCDVFGR